MKFIAAATVFFVLTHQVFAKPAEGCIQTHIVVSTDGCDSVAAQFKLTSKQFYDMNPGLHHSVRHDCDNLDTGKPYCVCMTEPCPVHEALALNNTASNSMLSSDASNSIMPSDAPISTDNNSSTASGASDTPNTPSTPDTPNVSGASNSTVYSGSQISSVNHARALSDSNTISSPLSRNLASSNAPLRTSPSTVASGIVLMIACMLG